MYLKKIIAHGFKSFADKITIELSDGIIGIVGPNGSGKSNVVDAVRWVLGEQSVKSLRGDGNMTDVIFSGSKSRNPLNVASVTLVFDNTDSYLPLAFSEVSIKRRVYMDGTNEYYLNGEKCRLKDINDVLIDSGVAKESFNIISQGKIEEIISSKPMERKIILEEAAGVLKYKKRKEDALRKLEKTHSNMSRVDDIVHELEYQIEPLKQQKDMALKYIDIKEQLQGIEIALITSDITNINYKYQDNLGKIEALKQELLTMTNNSSINEAKIEEYKLKISKLDEQIKNKQSELLNISSEVEKINGKKLIILERKKYQVDDIKLHNNVLELKEQSFKIDNDINIINNGIKNMSLDLENINNKLKQQNDYFNKIKDDKYKITTLLSNKIKDETYLNNKIETLKQNIENNGTLPYSVRSILSNPKLKGINDVIGNLIELDDTYSKAISVSLGVNANNIVVDNEEYAKEAINYLKTNNIGRATFFPLNIIKSKSIDEETKKILNFEGCVGIASELIKFDNKYKNIIENQLGNVLICKDIESANILSKKINYRYRIVTLEGELLHVGGSITGGNESKQNNIVSIKYDLENSIKELEKKELEIKQLEQNINQYDELVKNQEDVIYLSSREKFNIEESLNEKKSKLSELLLKLDTNNEEIKGTNNVLNNSLDKEEEEILNEYYETVKEKDNIQNDLNILLNEKQNLNDELEQFEYSCKKENSSYNLKNNELKTLEIEVNRNDVKLDTLLNNLNENYNMTYEKAVSLYKLELDEEIARKKVNKLKQDLKEIGDVNLTAPAEYDKVSTRYEFLLNQREDLVKAENILLEIIDELDSVMKKEFLNTFNIIKKNFTETFKELFKGGTAELKLTDEENILETGVEIVASPPGKKLTSISLLSGGEKTFTAISLLFAILKSRPVPFCILDEVEAALDEVNVDSFGNYINKLKEKTQFILITHKKKTMEYVDLLYGITMQESGVSKLVSVKLEEIK